MNKKYNWPHTAYNTGIILLIIGAIDPLEGAVLIAAGSILLCVATYLKKDPQWKVFLTLMALIVTGICMLFLLSYFGGFGKGALSWWWALLLIPYPIGWLATIIIIIIRGLKKTKKESVSL